MRFAAASGLCLAAGAAAAQGSPQAVAEGVLAACMAERGSAVACMGRAEMACLEDPTAFPHAPNPDTRREWCVRAETTAFLALVPGAAIPWEACALEDVEADDLQHLEEAICARDALVERLEARQ